MTYSRAKMQNDPNAKRNPNAPSSAPATYLQRKSHRIARDGLLTAQIARLAQIHSITLVIPPLPQTHLEA